MYSSLRIYPASSNTYSCTVKMLPILTLFDQHLLTFSINKMLRKGVKQCVQFDQLDRASNKEKARITGTLWEESTWRSPSTGGFPSQRVSYCGKRFYVMTSSWFRHWSGSEAVKNQTVCCQTISIVRNQNVPKHQNIRCTSVPWGSLQPDFAFQGVKEHQIVPTVSIKMTS